MAKQVPCIFERLFPGQRCAKHHVTKKPRRTKTIKKAA